jgi:hypothetical protein
LPSNFYNAKTISAVAKRQSFSNENLFVDAAAKGHFSGYVSLPKNFRTTPAAIFVLPIDIEKLIKPEGLILVKLSRTSIQNSQGCCTFQVSPVYTAFVGISFDATSDF